MTRMFEVNGQRVKEHSWLQWLDANGQPIGAPIPCNTEAEAEVILQNDPDKAVAYQWCKMVPYSWSEARLIEVACSTCPPLPRVR